MIGWEVSWDGYLFVFVPNVGCEEEVFFVFFPVRVFYHTQAWRRGGLTDARGVLLVAEAPGQGQDAESEDNGAERNQARAQRVDQVGLVEVRSAPSRIAMML